MGDEKARYLRMAKTNKQIDALQSELDALRQKKEAVEAAMHETGRQLYIAQREFAKKEKPTPAMLSTLRELAQGGRISRIRFSHAYCLINESNTTALRDSIFYGLLSREAIEEIKGNREREYRITEHGRAIFAKYSTSRKRDAEITTIDNESSFPA